MQRDAHFTWPEDEHRADLGWSQCSQLDGLPFWLNPGGKERPAPSAQAGQEKLLAPSPWTSVACRRLAGLTWLRGYASNGSGNSRQIPSSNLIYAATKPIGHQCYERVTKYSTWIIFSRCLTGWKQVRLHEAFISLGSVSDYTDIAQRPWERGEQTTASSFHAERLGSSLGISMLQVHKLQYLLGPLIFRGRMPNISLRKKKKKRSPL